MAPEAKIKAKLYSLITGLKSPLIWQYSAVETGFGTRALDKLLCVNGHFVAIECKADPTKKLTAQQQLTRSNIEAAKGTVLVVCDELTMREALAFLCKKIAS